MLFTYCQRVVDAVLAAWVGGQVERSVDAVVARAAAVSDPYERLALLIEDQCATFASQRHRLGAEHFESEAASPAVRAEVMAKMAPLRRLLTRTLAEAGATADPEKHVNSIFAKLDLPETQDVSRRVKAALIFLSEVEEIEPR